MHVLVVESDPIISQSLVRYVQAHGATAQAVQGALHAIQACDQTLPDVIVLDLSLTGHSGIEFMHEFKSYSDWHAIPVVAWSMQSYSPKQQKALRHLGVVTILYKPQSTLADVWQVIQSQATVSYA